MNYHCQVWRFWFKPFLFYRADRQTDRITDADERYTHTTTVGMSQGHRVIAGCVIIPLILYRLISYQRIDYDL